MDWARLRDTKTFFEKENNEKGTGCKRGSPNTLLLTTTKIESGECIPNEETGDHANVKTKKVSQKGKPHY